MLRHGLIAAACGRLDQFTGSGPVLKLGGAESFSSIRAFIAPVSSSSNLPGKPAVDEA
jgi:hypothetical protein